MIMLAAAIATFAWSGMAAAESEEFGTELQNYFSNANAPAGALERDEKAIRYWKRVRWPQLKKKSSARAAHHHLHRDERGLSERPDRVQASPLPIILSDPSLK